MLWRSGYAAVCKTAYTGSIPVGTSIFFAKNGGAFHRASPQKRKQAFFSFGSYDGMAPFGHICYNGYIT